MALAAGIALAATTQLHDSPDVSQVPDEILNSIDPTQLATPASSLFDRLDTGSTAMTPDDLTSNDTDQELTLAPLEPRAFAKLLELLDSE